jgi:hypothetical protein
MTAPPSPRRYSAAVKSARLAIVAVVALCVGAAVESPPADASTPPQATVGLQTESFTSARADFGLLLNDDDGLASYDVRTANTSMLAPRRAAWAMPAALQGVTISGTDASRRVKLPLARGRVLCVSVRAHDVDGNAGAWSEQSCAVRAFDDSALVRRGRTRAVRDSRYWGGRATEISSHGQLLLRGVPKGSRVVVIATDLDQRDPRYNGRNLPFTVPSATSVRKYAAGWRWGPTRYTQVTTAGRDSGRSGTVVFRHSGYPDGRSPGWTSPFEGVAVRPSWL